MADLGDTSMAGTAHKHKLTSWITVAVLILSSVVIGVAQENAAGDVNRQALAGEFIDDREALEALTIGAGVEYEIVGPKVVRPHRRNRPRPKVQGAMTGDRPDGRAPRRCACRAARSCCNRRRSSRRRTWRPTWR